MIGGPFYENYDPQPRPKKTWMEVIRQDMEGKGVSEGILLDRNEWRKLIHVPDPAYFSFGSCSLPQILGINGLVVVVVVVPGLQNPDFPNLDSTTIHEMVQASNLQLMILSAL